MCFNFSFSQIWIKSLSGVRSLSLLLSPNYPSISPFFSSPFPTPTVLCIIHALGVTSSVNIPTKQHTHIASCASPSLPLLHTLTISHTNYSHPIQSAAHFVDLSVACPPPLCRDLQHFDRRQAGTGTYKNTYINLIQ